MAPDIIEPLKASA